MSPTLRPLEEVRLKRTAMSTRELRRAEVLGRVRSKTLRLVDAAKILALSYRQTKRLWERYRGEACTGLKHRSAGRGFEPADTPTTTANQKKRDTSNEVRKGTFEADIG
jgi:hypothetical protein